MNAIQIMAVIIFVITLLVATTASVKVAILFRVMAKHAQVYNYAY